MINVAQVVGKEKAYFVSFRFFENDFNDFKRNKNPTKEIMISKIKEKKKIDTTKNQ